MLEDNLINFIGFGLVILNMLVFFSGVFFFIKSFYCLFYDRAHFFSSFVRFFLLFFLSGLLYYLISSNADLLNFNIIEKVD